MAEAGIGMPEAEDRLRMAVRCLRKRMRDDDEEELMKEAGCVLASLMKPSRRLRGRHHPESVR